MAADGLPALSTGRLILRPRKLADLDACFAMDREPGTLDWIDWPEEAGSWADEAAHRAFIRARIEEPYPDGMGYWVMEPRARPGTFLGWILMIPEDAAGPEIEIGWRVPPAHRGQGYAVEGAKRVLAHGFATLGLARVIADIHPQNAASCRVAEKIGMLDRGPTPEAERLRRYSATRTPT